MRDPVFPVTAETSTITVQDEPCDLAVTLYADRTLVVISQTGTLGSILTAKQDSLLPVSSLGAGGWSTCRRWAGGPFTCRE